MTEISFYHLQRQPIEAALPRLLEKSIARGWRALVKVASDERLGHLDDRLWDYSAESFLAHGRTGEPDPETQPVLLTGDDANLNGAAILFLLDGATPPADLAGYERVMLVFDHADADAVAAARGSWTAMKAVGHAVSYWQEDDAGRWQKKA